MPSGGAFEQGDGHHTHRGRKLSRKDEQVHGPAHKRPDRLRSKGHDGMAHPSHHQANADHGTPMGFAPPEGYQDGGCDHHLGDNVADED